jgi:hypothetical protein
MIPRMKELDPNQGKSENHAWLSWLNKLSWLGFTVMKWHEITLVRCIKHRLLVGGLEHLDSFSNILGISSSQVTNSYFSAG